MKSAKTFVMVFSTAPDRKTARRLAQAALKARLAACVQLIPGLESYYWWKGRQEMGRETLLLFKTKKTLLEDLETLILKQHPYATPELVALPMAAGNKAYLKWLKTNCKKM